MLEESGDVPTHVLLVHAAVVFVPLLALGGILYAAVPGLRARIGWVVGLLAVVGPLSALLSMLSGRTLEAALIARNYPPAILDQVADHRVYGERTFWFSFGLGLAAAALVFVTQGRRRPHLPTVARLGLAGLVVLLGAITAVQVFLAGDSGAKAVWRGVL